MVLSKHNIISQIADSDKFFIVNLLSQHADIIDEYQKEIILSGNVTEYPELLKKGYVVDPLEEEKNFKMKYLDFLDKRYNDETQIFFIPSYACNFSCSYCYQKEYLNKPTIVDDKVVNAFFTYINNFFQGKRKYLTLFGGEPLLNTAANISFLRHFIDLANQNNLEIALVTNGYHLSSMIPVLSKASVREIQVTLDGGEEMHNSRRFLRTGAPTFQQIVKGIDMALEMDFPVNLRVVVDKENILDLENLAKFSIGKGWTKHPLFKTQLGRNYELHQCQSKHESLFSRLDMYQAIYKLINQKPEIAEFYKPAFSISKFLFEEGELPDPLFDTCPATKTEWAFDYSGKIYPCTATVGKDGEELGTFYPEVARNENRIALWEERDVLNIGECKNCSVQLACGGGCGAVSKNKGGEISSPDCRPVKELMELGIAHYFRELI